MLIPFRLFNDYPENTLIAENKNLLKDHSLRYTGETDLCIRRKRHGRDFQYLDDRGKVIHDKILLERIKSLVIPPAWKDVLICSSPKGHIQAVGRDVRGRKQYIYHERWDEFRNNKKFDRLIEFGRLLPDIRKQVRKDLKKRSLRRQKVLAVIVRLLEETLIRVGNEVYAEENDSYGLTTLKDRHVDIKGINIYFHFNGKSGKPFELDIKDKTLADVVSSCQDLPGQNLFQYIDEEGKVQPVDSSDVNEYLNNITADNDITAKVFRTWSATVLAAENFSKVSPGENEKENKRIIAGIVKKTAQELNNTPAVCREYYIHPDIIKAWEDGYLVEVMNRKRSSAGGLIKSEKAVLKILRKYSAGRN